jgi:outer membrane protein OmpA-like peptidoglycan-associated protein
LEGSLDDPKFGYQTIINKLAGKGLKNAAIGYISNALQPFGALISISQMVMDAQEKGSFITLQPVIFEPAETTLSSESKAYMAKLAEMMNERKGMRMNICGVAVLADKPAIWAQLQETNKQQKAPLDETLLLLELEPALQALAQQRSDAVKTELSDKQGIDSERLFSCYPKVDLKSKDKPQVSLGL